MLLSAYSLKWCIPSRFNLITAPGPWLAPERLEQATTAAQHARWQDQGQSAGRTDLVKLNDLCSNAVLREQPFDFRAVWTSPAAKQCQPGMFS